ncbi:MAG: VOC family protein [Actinobacteria bacterium]|nr:VOC family protein [Actinomycetota bacterium]
MTAEITGLLGLGEGPYQVGIAVPDLEAAVEGFRAVTGCGPLEVWTYDRSELVRESTFRGEDAPYASRIAIGVGTTQVEYIEPLPGGVSIVHEHVERHGYGLHHLGFRTEDLEAAIARMAAAGFGTIQTISGWGLDGDGAAVFFDTFATLGFWTEVVSPAARRHPAHGAIPAAVG